jgi:hypothetical protein
MGKRLAGILAGIGVLLVAETTPLHAEDFPWCTELDPFTRSCTFATYEECAEVARTISAMCVRNAKYHPVPDVAAKPAAHREPHARH